MCGNALTLFPLKGRSAKEDGFCPGPEVTVETKWSENKYDFSINLYCQNFQILKFKLDVEKLSTIIITIKKVIIIVVAVLTIRLCPYKKCVSFFSIKE